MVVGEILGSSDFVKVEKGLNVLEAGGGRVLGTEA